MNEERNGMKFRPYEKCPSCGGVLIPRRNSQTGEQFLGCVNYARKTKGKCYFAANPNQIIWPEEEQSGVQIQINGKMIASVAVVERVIEVPNKLVNIIAKEQEVTV